MAHKPRPRKGPSVDEILKMGAQAGVGAPGKIGRGGAGSVASRGRRSAGAAQGPGKGQSRRNHVRGELMDPTMLSELSSLQRQRADGASWHVMGLDRRLDNAMLAADENTSIAGLRDGVVTTDGGEHGPRAPDEDEELERLRKEIEQLDGALGIIDGKSHPPSFAGRGGDGARAARGNSDCRNVPTVGVEREESTVASGEPRSFRERDTDLYGGKFGMEREIELGRDGYEAGNDMAETYGKAVMDPYGSGAMGGGVPFSGAPPQGVQDSQPSVVAFPYAGIGSLGGGGVADAQQRRAQAEAQQRAYRAELDEQVRQKATTVQHGRRQGQAQSYSTNEAGAGAEREARAERQQLYRAELDEQYRGHAMRGDSIGWSPSRSVGGATGGQSTHRSRVVQAAVSPQDMRVAARQVKTMHWGEAEVQRWHEDEERKKAYKEDLMRQVAEKKAREFHSGSMLPSSPNRSNPVLSAAGVAVSDVQGAAGGAPGAGGEPAGFSQADPQFQASPYGFPHHAVLAPALHGSQGAPRPFAGTPMHAQQHQVPPGYPTSSYVGWPAGAPPGGPLGDTLQGLAAYAPPVQRWVQAAGPPYQPHAVQYAVASSDSGAPASPSSQASSKTLDSMAAQMRAMQAQIDRQNEMIASLSSNPPASRARAAPGQRAKGDMLWREKTADPNDDAGGYKPKGRRRTKQ